jgi:8-oxo-dGTP pyrophosphatase MutT (NUDIX family)
LVNFLQRPARRRFAISNGIVDKSAQFNVRPEMFIEITPVARTDFSMSSWQWPFSRERQAEIAAHFGARSRHAPALWNGRVLLMQNHSLAGDALRGSFFETDFASFLAWRDWGFPDPSVKNCFAMGAIRGADGGYLLGEMGRHTSSPGSIYFPAGTPDPADIVEGAVDLAGSVTREVHEETGLAPEDYDAEPGWTAVFAGPRIALMKPLQAKVNAEALRARILRHLSQQTSPELADIHIVRREADLNARIPEFMHAFLRRALAV